MLQYLAFTFVDRSLSLDSSLVNGVIRPPYSARAPQPRGEFRFFLIQTLNKIHLKPLRRPALKVCMPLLHSIGFFATY
jgi:hypothetical protein